jgi:hypothetical protein
MGITRRLIFHVGRNTHGEHLIEKESDSIGESKNMEDLPKPKPPPLLKIQEEQNQPQEEQNQPQEKKAPGSFDLGGMDTGHFAYVVVEEPAGTTQEVATGTVEEGGEGPGGDIIGPDQFRSLFHFIFNTAGAMTPIKSLKIAEEEKESADSASDALYEIALEVPSMRFLIEVGNKNMQRAVVLGVFVYGKGGAVVAELKERKRERLQLQNEEINGVQEVAV